jgi:phosphatidate cytidylyltransferase
MNEVNKISNLAKRSITASILALLAFIALFTLPQVSYGIVTAFIIILTALEWPKLIGKGGAFNNMLFVCALILVMGFGVFVIQVTDHSGWASLILFALSFLLWIWLFAWVLTFEKKQRLLVNNTALNIILGLLILVFCWLGLNIIRDFAHGSFLTLFFLLLIWGADTIAYFAGKRWGTNKLAPVVSPKKTWEGVYGAVTFSLLLGLIAAALFPYSILQRLCLIPLAVIVTIFSIIGDLLISVFKRQYNLKDTGAILPGHGGMLDRVDSLIAGAPVFALGLMLLGLH